MVGFNINEDAPKAVSYGLPLIELAAIVTGFDQAAFHRSKLECRQLTIDV